jgi:hypothetical protein
MDRTANWFSHGGWFILAPKSERMKTPNVKLESKPRGQMQNSYRHKVNERNDDENGAQTRSDAKQSFIFIK